MRFQLRVVFHAIRQPLAPPDTKKGKIGFLVEEIPPSTAEDKRRIISTSREFRNSNISGTIGTAGTELLKNDLNEAKRWNVLNAPRFSNEHSG